MKPFCSKENIIKEVLKIYDSYISAHEIEEWIKQEFNREKEWIIHDLWNLNLESAIKRTISLFEYLDEHHAVHINIQYPGPTKAFKVLNASY